MPEKQKCETKPKPPPDRRNPFPGPDLHRPSLRLLIVHRSSFRVPRCPSPLLPVSAPLAASQAPARNEANARPTPAPSDPSSRPYYAREAKMRNEPNTRPTPAAPDPRPRPCAAPPSHYSSFIVHRSAFLATPPARAGSDPRNRPSYAREPEIRNEANARATPAGPDPTSPLCHAPEAKMRNEANVRTAPPSDYSSFRVHRSAFLAPPAPPDPSTRPCYAREAKKRNEANTRATPAGPAPRDEPAGRLHLRPRGQPADHAGAPRR